MLFAVNGIPTCASDVFNNQLLRDNWGWEGFIVSDYTAIELMNDWLWNNCQRTFKVYFLEYTSVSVRFLLIPLNTHFRKYGCTVVSVEHSTYEPGVARLRLWQAFERIHAHARTRINTPPFCTVLFAE